MSTYGLQNQKMLCMTHHAGMPRSTHLLAAMHAASCGVFVGTSWQDYSKLCQAVTGITGSTAVATALSVASGRIAYVFGMQGPTATGAKWLQYYLSDQAWLMGCCVCLDHKLSTAHSAVYSFCFGLHNHACPDAAASSPTSVWVTNSGDGL